MSQEQVANWVVGIVLGGALVIGLISMLVGKVVAIYDWARDQMTQAVERERINMSSKRGRKVEVESNEDAAFSPATTTSQNSNNALQSDATYGNGLLLGQARALAIAVRAGRYGETEGIKEIFGVSPSSTNPRYIAARAALKSELARLESPSLYRQDDGTTAPASRPITGRRTPA